MRSRHFKNKLIVLIVLLLSCSFGQQEKLFAQKVHDGTFYLYEAPLSPDVPNFNMAIINTAADSDLSRIKLTLDFIYDELQFIKVKRKKEFRADIEVKVTVFDTTGNEVEYLKWSDFVTVKSFDETNSADLTHTTRSNLDLPPGIYEIEIELKDLETRRIGKRKGKIKVRDFSKNNFMVSDIELVDSLVVATSDDQGSNGNHVTKHFAHFEIYNAPQSDSIEIEYEIVNPLGEISQKDTIRIINDGKLTHGVIPIDEGSVRDKNNRLRMTLRSNDETIKWEQTLKCFRPAVESPFENIDDAIEKVVYIAKKDEMKKLEKAQGVDKIDAFNKFWESRDPTPETRQNEYMIEYYDRIAYANKTFKKNNQGWKTDMGMVYILLGPPDYVDSPVNYDNFYDPTGTTRPTLIWQYNNLRRRVVFRYEIGEYRIANYSDVFDILNDGMRF